MTPLPTQLNVGGFALAQVARTDTHAIYSQSKGGTVVSYEVIEIQKRPAETIMGKQYPAREGYPHNEQWGVAAWTCDSLARARERFAGLAAA